MSLLSDPEYGTLLLLHPPVPLRRSGPSLPYTRPAAHSWAPTAEPESSAAGDVGAGADGAGAAAPGGPRPPEGADKRGEPVCPLPHPAAGGFLHGPARWEWEPPHRIAWPALANVLRDVKWSTFTILTLLCSNRLVWRMGRQLFPLYQSEKEPWLSPKVSVYHGNQ